MEIVGHFQNIKDYLAHYTKFWQQEIINYYPQSLGHYPEEWIQCLDRLSSEELWKIDSKQDFSAIKNASLLEYFQTAKALSDEIQQQLHPPPQLPDWAFTKVNGKKRHEIEQIFGQLIKLKQTLGFDQVVDIGGGVGHLSRTLAHYGGIACTCIDKDSELLARGQKRAAKYPAPPLAATVDFIQCEIHPNMASIDFKLKELFGSRALILGLHTCGPLALKLMEFLEQSECLGLFNFGCCYAKLDPQTETNLSKISQKTPLKLSTHALTLATRSHCAPAYKDYLLKERVKAYRFGLHLLLYEELGLKDFLSVGNYPLPLYWKSFSQYALTKLTELKLKHTLSSDDLEKFYAQARVQALIRQMFLSNIIRWQLGRLLELYVLLDRCLYLQEKGLETSLHAYFEESISPRNLGILALKGTA